MVIFAFASCSKDEDQPATVNIEVSYYYNTYQGYRPDIGAIAYLCEKDKSNAFHNDSTAALFIRVGMYADKTGDLIQIPYKYKGEAGVSGKINIPSVDPGDYLLLLASKGRYLYSFKYITIHSGENVELVKNFYYLREFNYGGEAW
jgi:hypothetical protein